VLFWYFYYGKLASNVQQAVSSPAPIFPAGMTGEIGTGMGGEREMSGGIGGGIAAAARQSAEIKRCGPMGTSGVPLQNGSG